MEQMIKVRCPECGTEITDVNNACPNCGLPAANLKAAQEAAIFEEEKKQRAEGEKRAREEESIRRLAEVSINQQFEVNPNAEKILNSIATAFIVVSWIIGIILIIVGIIVASEGSSFEMPAAIAGIVFGVIQILIGYIAWASLKVVVNISRNLYNINSNLSKKS